MMWLWRLASKRPVTLISLLTLLPLIIGLVLFFLPDSTILNRIGCHQINDPGLPEYQCDNAVFGGGVEYFLNLIGPILFVAVGIVYWSPDLGAWAVLLAAVIVSTFLIWLFLAAAGFWEWIIIPFSRLLRTTK